MKYTKCLYNKYYSMNKKITALSNITHSYFCKYNDGGNEFNFVKYEIAYDLYKKIEFVEHLIPKMNDYIYDDFENSLANIIEFKHNNNCIDTKDFPIISSSYAALLVVRYRMNNFKINMLENQICPFNFKILKFKNDLFNFEILRLHNSIQIYTDLIDRHENDVLEEHQNNIYNEMSNVIKYNSLVCMASNYVQDLIL